MGVQEHFLMAEGLAVSSNTRHFVRDVFRSVCRVYWEVGPGCSVISGVLVGNVNWVSTSSVWHLDSHMLTGFTSRKSATLHMYIMKAVHYRLPDVDIWKKVLSKAFAFWAFLVDTHSLFPSAVSWVLDLCYSDVGLYSIICKSFVLKKWCEKTIGVFNRKDKAVNFVVDLVGRLIKLHHSKVWLLRSELRVCIEKAGLVGNSGMLLSLSCYVNSVLLDSVIRFLSVLKFFAVSFGYCKLCLFFFGLDSDLCINIGV
ncbi:hypothetical protein G9A89_008545 [Geosiphon pyriformis]|nr:hypothetical protein G9A89_008545 [Geosiphon pyriformis]